MTIKDNNVDFNDLSERILGGVRKAVQDLVEKSAANNESLVISDGKGNPKSVPAKKLLKALPKQLQTT